MNVPTQFERQLQEEFNGRFRIRWSQKLKEFQIEQKVFTGQIMPPPFDENKGEYDTYSDEWVRASDGYFLVMSIRNGDRMPCPVCGLTVKVPIMETRESHCQGCIEHGRDGRYVAAYYPLNHVLIEHLHDIDPWNGGPERVRLRMRAKQLAKQDRDMKLVLDEGEERTADDRLQLDQVPMVGYGHKTAQRGDETRFL